MKAIRTTHAGRNFVQYDMPAQVKSRHDRRWQASAINALVCHRQHARGGRAKFRTPLVVAL